MIHQLVIILLLSQSTSSTARHAMEDLRIIAANALVKNIGRAYASLNDVVTPSIVEHVSARVLETTASSIQAAITRIAAQQQSFQEVTETRLAVLRSNIDGFFKSIPESNNTHIQNASVSPCVGVELDKLTPTRLSPSFSSAPEQSLQICSQVNKYDIPEQFCAARRTVKNIYLCQRAEYKGRLKVVNLFKPYALHHTSFYLRGRGGSCPPKQEQ